MPTWIVPPASGLMEPAAAPEFFIDNVGAIELTGDLIRIFYCTEQLPLGGNETEPNRIVAVKIVRPLASVPDAITRMAMCLRGQQTKNVSPLPRGLRPVP